MDKLLHDSWWTMVNYLSFNLAPKTLK